MKTVIHYIAGSYFPLTETWLFEQIKNLKRYKPIVYALKTENLDIYPTENIRSLELKEGLRDPWTFFNVAWNRLFNFYPSFAFSLMKDKPNLVHAHFGPSGYSFLGLKRMFKLPLITSFYGYDLSILPHRNSKWKTRYKKLFQEGNLFLAEGHCMKKCLIELGCPEKKIIVQHLGIDLDQIKFVPRKLSEDEEIKILIAASFREKKGIPYAVDAFGQVKQRHPQLKLELTIIGDSMGILREEKEKAKILTVIKKYRLNNCVKMLGYQPHFVFLKELERHHIFLSPSIHASDGDTEGGAPVSIIEASASGMPVLSTYHCDIPEIIIDGKNGFLVSERDIKTLTERLEYLFYHSDEWRRMGIWGRKHIEKEYDVKKQVRRLEEIYDEMME